MGTKSMVGVVVVLVVLLGLPILGGMAKKAKDDNGAATQGAVNAQSTQPSKPAEDPMMPRALSADEAMRAINTHGSRPGGGLKILSPAAENAATNLVKTQARINQGGTIDVNDAMNMMNRAMTDSQTIQNYAASCERWSAVTAVSDFERTDVARRCSSELGSGVTIIFYDTGGSPSHVWPRSARL